MYTPIRIIVTNPPYNPPLWIKGGQDEQLGKWEKMAHLESLG